VDGLIAVTLLTISAGLTLLAPGGVDRPTWLLLSTVAFLGAAKIVMLGTRTAARLRWAIVLPLAAGSAASHTPLAHGAQWLVRNGSALLAQPFTSGPLTVRYGGQLMVVPDGVLPGVALAGAVLTLFLAGLGCFGLTRRLVVELVPGVLAVASAGVLSVVAMLAAGRAFGPAMVQIAWLPMVSGVVLAATVAIVVWGWSRATAAPEPAPHHHLPRWRFAAAVLAAVAVALGAHALPALAVAGPVPVVAPLNEGSHR
jgi:hypothetical protein